MITFSVATNPGIAAGGKDMTEGGRKRRPKDGQTKREKSCICGQKQTKLVCLFDTTPADRCVKWEKMRRRICTQEWEG